MQTKRFIQDFKDEIIYEKEYKYQVPFEHSDYYVNMDEIIVDALKSDELLPSYFDFIKDLFSYYFEYSAFTYVILNKEDDALERLSQVMGYSSIILREALKTCGCFKGNNPFIISNKATFMASTLLLTHQTDDFTIASKNLIDSLNGKNCIIKKGYRKATISWFVLKLFSLYTQQEITLHPLLQPKLNDTYNKILKEWDTTDNKTLDFDIEALCELHLSQAANDLADVDAHYRDDIYNLRYRELFIPALYTLPYEVLVWLKLRELKGLKNPKTFTHPLMNTPIAKMFLNIKEPLPYPKELPYAKELLEKLQEQCPDVEIPQWLEGVSGSVNKKDNTIGDDLFIK